MRNNIVRWTNNNNNNKTNERTIIIKIIIYIVLKNRHALRGRRRTYINPSTII